LKLTGFIEKPIGRKKTTVALLGCHALAGSGSAVRDQRLMPDAQYLLLGIGSEVQADSGS
jgi:hypothetical protein